MNLSPAQLQTLKASILADPVLSLKPQNEDGAYDIAAAYNQLASPAFTVWKSYVSNGAVSMAINMQELNALTGNTTALQTMFILSEGFNPYLADRRNAFATIFAGTNGPLTRPALDILWRRLATRAEKLYATGTGTDASPATLVQEGALSLSNVLDARSS